MKRQEVAYAKELADWDRKIAARTDELVRGADSSAVLHLSAACTSVHADGSMAGNAFMRSFLSPALICAPQHRCQHVGARGQWSL